VKNQWYHPIEWPGWGEVEKLAAIRPVALPHATEQAQQPQTILFGPRGEPLLVKQPRPIGFRKP